MSFERIAYLQWARRNLDKVRYDLARSNLHGLSKEDLGLALEEIEITKAVESEPTRLEEALAARYDLPADQIQLTCGATMGLFAIYEALLEPGDEVLLETPNYEPLYAGLRRKQVRIRPVERVFESGWDLDMAEVQRKIGPNTKAIVLTNLQNPTGAATSQEKLSALAAIARDYDAYVVVDEAYMEPDLPPGLTPAVMCGRNAVTVGSLSKMYGLGYLRVGWIACRDEEVMRRLDVIVNDHLIGAASMPAVSIGELALRRRETLLPKIKEVIDTNLKILSGWISRHNDFTWVRPSGGTVAFIKLPSGVDDMKLSEVLRERHDTLVAPGHFFWKRGYIRISFGCEPDILRGGLRQVQAAVDEMLRR